MKIKALLNIKTGDISVVGRPTKEMPVVGDVQYTGLNPDYVPVSGVEVGGVVTLDIDKAITMREANLKILKDARNAKLMSLESVQGADVIDCRPTDQLNIETGIKNDETEWVSKDDKVITVTTEILQAVLDDGVAQAIVVWKEYKDAVKAL